jgi:hypothetical protein
MRETDSFNSVVPPAEADEACRLRTSRGEALLHAIMGWSVSFTGMTMAEAVALAQEMVRRLPACFFSRDRMCLETTGAGAFHSTNFPSPLTVSQGGSHE